MGRFGYQKNNKPRILDKMSPESPVHERNPCISYKIYEKYDVVCVNDSNSLSYFENETITV